MQLRKSREKVGTKTRKKREKNEMNCHVYACIIKREGQRKQKRKQRKKRNKKPKEKKQKKNKKQRVKKENKEKKKEIMLLLLCSARSLR